MSESMEIPTPQEEPEAKGDETEVSHNETRERVEQAMERAEKEIVARIGPELFDERDAA